MLKRWSLLAAAIVIVGAVGTAMVLGIAQQPPPLPQGHIPIAPGTPAATCFECHQSPPPLKTEQVGFCKTCHLTTHIVDRPGFTVERPGPGPSTSSPLTGTPMTATAAIRRTRPRSPSTP
jgi:hypothetical protein